MNKLKALMIVCLFVFSCGNPKIISVLQEESVGQVPCPAHKIEIVQHEKLENGDMMWTALCLGETYECTDKGGVVSCNEMSSQFPD